MVRIFDKEDEKDKDEDVDGDRTTATGRRRQDDDDDENNHDELLGMDLSRASLPRFYVHWKQKTSLTRGLECR